MSTPILRGALRQDWAGLGACVSGDPDDLFVKGAAQQQAKEVRPRCPPTAERPAEARDSGPEFGVWGGMTERERRALLRRNPTVTSWWAMFAHAGAGRADVAS